MTDNNKTKILLVEDDEFIAEIYVTKFKSEGFEIELTNEGDQVFSKIKDFNPDLIILDIVLPKMSGIDILKKLKAGNSEFTKIPVVILTNLGGREEIEEGLAAGAVDYIVKSQVIPAEVVKTVKDILKNHIKQNRA